MKFFPVFLLITSSFLFSQQYPAGENIDKLIEKALYFLHKDKDSAYYYARKSFDLLPQIKNDSLKKRIVFNYLAGTPDLNELDSVGKIYERKFLKNKDNPSLQELYFTIGRNYFTKNLHDLALKYYLKVDSLEKNARLFNAVYVQSLLDRASISKQTFTPDGVDTALSIAQDAEKKAAKLGDSSLIAKTSLALAELYLMTNKTEKGLEHLKKAEKFFSQSTEYYPEISFVYLIYMNYFYGLKKYAEAGRYLKKGIELLSGSGYNKALANLYVFYGDYFKNKMYDYEKAYKQYLKADSIYFGKHTEPSLHYVYLLEGLSESYEKSGNYKKALYYNKLAYKKRKALYRKQNRDLSRKLEMKFQAKERAFRLQQAEEQKKNQRNIYLSISSLMFLSFLFVFILYRNNKKITRKLKNIDREKSLMFANISHEFRTPLTLILAPTEHLLQKKNMPREAGPLLKSIRHNAGRLLHLVTQLLDIAKIETHTFNLRITQNDPQEFFGVVLESYKYLSRQKNIKFSHSVSVCQESWFDREVLEKILTNLLSNAFKYTPEEGEIVCQIYCENKKLVLNIRNTGKLLTKKEQKRIFERFYRADYTKEGTGLGLALVKELVIQHRGKIKVSTEKPHWNIFQVIIPVNKKAYKGLIKETENKMQDAVSVRDDQAPVFHSLPENASKDKESIPVLLVIDDNDELRALIKSIFSGAFKILEAKDGEEGIRKAVTYIPDIIISDVMMPGKDGYTLTSVLKKDFKTGHIPIILLTAKAGEQNILEGTHAGADDYIVKPFSIELLKRKVFNLMELRKKIRERYKSEMLISSRNIATPQYEKNFMDRIERVLKEHITNPEFSTEKFASALHLSRMQLHRKLKNLTGLSTAEFIRIQRLKLAVSLMQQSDAHISEIAYRVGFNSPAYFSKLFKETYGCTPSEYLKKNRQNKGK